MFIIVRPTLPVPHEEKKPYCNNQATSEKAVYWVKVAITTMTHKNMPMKGKRQGKSMA
jgi:hypothetical protein